MNFFFLKTIIPPYLKKGDTIAIAATARSITEVQLQNAIEVVESNGFKVYLHPELYQVHHQFAGTDEHRAKVFNDLLKNEEVKAIWIARGGYGTARMIDKVDFTLLKNQPKWIAGFSDVTVLLNHVYTICNMATLHSTMPIFLHDKFDEDLIQAKEAVHTLLHSLQGHHTIFDLNNNEKYNESNFEGEIIGGNLSVLVSILNSDSDCNWDNKILFIEDLDEYFYHIDRMLLMLKRAGKLKNLKALLVGSFIQMKDHQIPFGYNVKEMVLQHSEGYNYPIVFDVDAGHHLHNLTIPFGINAKYYNGFLTFANS